jgi:hypothetical protein
MLYKSGKYLHNSHIYNMTSSFFGGLLYCFNKLLPGYAELPAL